MKPGKTRKTVGEENAITKTTETTFNHLARTAGVAGSARREGTMMRQTTVKNIPSIASVAAGARRRKAN